MIGQILPNNNERCYNNFSTAFYGVNTPIDVNFGPAIFSALTWTECGAWTGALIIIITLVLRNTLNTLVTVSHIWP
jgi:hypothetical protein